MTLVVAIWGLAIAILIHAWSIYMSDFSRLVAAVAALAPALAVVAERLRDPNVNNNDQSVIDDLAGRVESAVASLNEFGASGTGETGGDSSQTDQGSGVPGDGAVDEGSGDSEPGPTDETGLSEEGRGDAESDEQPTREESEGGDEGEGQPA